jgi:hypothetical protein
MNLLLTLKLQIMKHEIKIETTISLTDQDIDDLMVTALEGAVTYWCGEAKPKLVPDGVEYEYLSELIAKGGVIELTDAEDEDEKWDLNLSKFLNGVAMVCQERGFGSGEELINNHDAEIADMIIQYALFSEIVFG